MIDLPDLVEEHEQALHNFAMQLTKSDFEADDLVQDTWIKANLYLPLLGYLSVQKQRSWLFSVLKNRWIDICRKRKLEQQNLQRMVEIKTIRYPSYKLESYLSELPSQQKEVLHLKYWMGYNSRQISEELGIPEGTIRWWLKLAMDTLRKLIIQSNKEEQCLL